MKKFALAIAALAVGTVGASAADMAPRYAKAPMVAPVAVYNWTGFYIGVNGGWGWSDTDRYDAVGALVAGPRQSGDGGFIGGTVGYNWQGASPFVFGIEGDAAWADINSSVVGGACGAAFTCSFQNRFLASIRGRVGYAANNWLFFVTGGVAFTEFRYRTFTTATGVDFGTPFNTSPVGWVVGAGVEYAFNNNWSIKGEYNYYGFDTQQAPAGSLTGAPVDTRTNIQVAKFGVNYRFGGPGAVVAKY